MKILLSIKPQHAHNILNGTKKYEFRRRVHRDSRVHTVVIYATKPLGKVVGEFSIKRVHSAPPETLWEKTKNFSGITKNLFSEYFNGKEIGHAIEVKKVKKYRKPMELSDFLPSGVAPQSYAYLPE